MLTLFSSLRVPGVPHVAVYRDHADPEQFYLIPDRPALALSTEPDESGSHPPLFSFTLFSRDIDIAYASAGPNGVVESQLGQLTMTVDISVSNEHMELIRTHLRGLLSAERTRRSSYNQLFETTTRGTEPRLDYPSSWTEGTVELAILEGLGDTFQRASSREVKCNLQGTLSTSLWATFGSEGAQLMWKSLREGQGSGGAPVPVQANVVYHLHGYQRIPSIKIDVVADGETVYRELREQTRVYESGGGQTFNYPQIADLTKTLIERDAITVNDDDWSLPGVDNSVNDEIRQTVLTLITNQLIQKFFESAVIQGVGEDDLGSTFPHLGHNIPGNKLWLRKYEEGYYPHIEFHYKRSQNVAFEAHPQTSLLAALTPEQAENLVRVVDVGSPEVRWMEVHVTTNADFVGDKVHRINVQLDYDEADALTGERLQRSQAFSFATGQETFVFRTRLAQTPDGGLIDRYDAKAQIVYQGIAEAPPPLTFKNISDRALTISYDRLGFLKVTVQAGDVDWQEISEIFVDLVYDGAAGEPDAAKQVKLTADEPMAQWTANKHGRSTNRYRYVVKYKYRDGSEVVATPETSDRGTLLVHDALVGVTRRTFDVVLDSATVKSVAVRVRTTNPETGGLVVDTNVFTASGSWTWERRLTEGASTSFEYSVVVQYADGLVTESDWTTVNPDDSVPIIQARRHKIRLQVDGEGLSWDRWRTVYVNLTYVGPHGYGVNEELRLKRESAFATLEVLGFAFDQRDFQYSAVFVPANGGEPIEVPGEGGTTSHRGVLLLESIQPPPA